MEVSRLGVNVPVFICVRCGFEDTTRPSEQRALTEPKRVPHSGELRPLRVQRAALPPTEMDIEMVKADLIALERELRDD